MSYDPQMDINPNAVIFNVVIPKTIVSSDLSKNTLSQKFNVEIIIILKLELYD